MIITSKNGEENKKNSNDQSTTQLLEAAEILEKENLVTYFPRIIYNYD